VRQQGIYVFALVGPGPVVPGSVYAALRPDDLTSLVLRTDFSDDEKWEAVQAEVDSWSDYKQAVYVSDRTYDSVDIQQCSKLLLTWCFQWSGRR
jgi:hypothetical protein